MNFDIISFTLGTFFGGLSFLLTYKPSWRNWITGEFRLRISKGERRVDEEQMKFKKLQIVVEFKSTHAEEIQLTDVYLKFSKKAGGTGKLGQSIPGEDHQEFFNALWRTNRDIGAPLVVSKYLVIPLQLRQTLLEQINNRKLRYLVVVVESNKYGVVKSNKLKMSIP